MKKLNIVLITTAGILNILGAFFHYFFWHIFNWKETLMNLSTLNANIMLMLNYCIATFFLLLGILIIYFKNSILESKLGRSLLLTIGIVYLVRLVLEFMLPESSLAMGGVLLLIITCYLVPTFTPFPYKDAEEISLH